MRLVYVLILNRSPRCLVHGRHPIIFIEINLTFFPCCSFGEWHHSAISKKLGNHFILPLPHAPSPNSDMFLPRKSLTICPLIAFLYSSNPNYHLFYVGDEIALLTWILTLFLPFHAMLSAYCIHYSQGNRLKKINLILFSHLFKRLPVVFRIKMNFTSLTWPLLILFRPTL